MASGVSDSLGLHFTPENTKCSSGRISDNDLDDFELRKRLPSRMSMNANDVYVTNKTNFNAQMDKCQRLLDGGKFDQVFIHALGVAVNRAISLALQIKRRYCGSVDLSTQTSTVVTTDDLLPLLDDQDAKSRSRNVSAIHIKLFRPEVPVCDY